MIVLNWSRIVRNETTYIAIICWFIIALGIILRLDQYLFNRSFWLDEACYAGNIANRTFLDFFIPPLEYTGLVMPPSFLIMVKLTTVLFGNNDFILRLFPFICGLVSLILFYPFAKIYISPRAVPFALFFFAISDRLIYYSSEFKQYSCDVMIVLILFLLLHYVRKNSHTPWHQFLSLTIVGSLAIWFAYPAVFALAIIGLYLLYQAFLDKQWQQVIKLVSVYTIWLFNFLILFIFIVKVDVPTNVWLHHFWVIEDAFMPFPFSLHGMDWLFDNFLKLSHYAGFNHGEFAALFFIFGSLTLFVYKRPILLLLLSPFLLTLGVSFFHQYPFSGRVLLFLLPFLYLLVAEGLIHIRIELPTNMQKTGTFILIAILTMILLASPTFRALAHWKTPRLHEETRLLFEYVEKNRQDTDTIYLYYWVEPSFRYYANFYHFNYEDCHLINPIPTDHDYIKEVDYFRQKLGLVATDVDKTQCVLGVSEFFGHAQKDLEKLRHRGRVWFIFSHIDDKERKLFLNVLDTLGTRLEENLQPGASLHLYELNR